MKKNRYIRLWNITQNVNNTQTVYKSVILYYIAE